MHVYGGEFMQEEEQATYRMWEAAAAREIRGTTHASADDKRATTGRPRQWLCVSVAYIAMM